MCYPIYIFLLETSLLTSILNTMAYYAQTLAICLFWFCISGFCSVRDNITTSHFLRDPETLMSSKATFKFGFFSPVNPTNRYIGIWYNTKVDDKLEVISVSNREAPLNDSSGVLKVSKDCNLHLLDAHNRSMLLSNVALKSEVTNCVAQLLDTGNLVLYSNSSGNVLWQSFDLPTDTFLPHMQATVDENYTGPLIAGSSWKSPSDPSFGRFSSGLNHRMPSEIFIWDGDSPYWRSGPWDGTMFLGIWGMYFSAKNDGFHIESDEEGIMNISFSSASKRVREHYVLNYDGTGLQKDWDDDKGGWYIFWQTLESECDFYGKCGEFGRCNKLNVPICSCLMGFQPVNNQEWSAGNWSSGCARRTPLQCQRTRGHEDGFLRLTNMKVPDNAIWLDSINVDDCRGHCLRNCSCSAYAHKLGYGCMIWIGSLIDIQDFTVVGVDLFIRLAHSELVGDSLWKVSIVFIIIIGAADLVVFYYILWRCMNQQCGTKEELRHNSYKAAKTSDVEFQDLPLFNFEELVVATDNFSESNKLGRGGFGLVYKGKLEDGQEIAVKRLSRASLQGLQEFMNEVVVISELQHRNLVRLLGCCAEEEEKLLVYEYLPNKSLDALLFDPVHRESLDWKCRLNIIKGISRGLLYLHRDSRLKIIHRDLKASNILLDHNLDPKISDFGMARIFRGNEDQGDTKRIVGTYGYMSPEYAMEGRFSEKSDVFSFGVLLLEIVSGRRNKSFIEEEDVSLLAHVWKLWHEDDSLSFVDTKISTSTFEEEILTCIQLGLLCVQEFPEDRPTISMVISMIENEATDLPRPKQPGFTQRRSPGAHYTANGVSVSSLIGR